MTAPAVRDERSGEYFDALRDGRLLIRRCVPHGHFSAPEVMFCAECGATDLAWEPASGAGEVISWTAIHSRPDDSGATTVTALVGLIELAEGPWLLAPLLADDPHQVGIGAAVTLETVEAGEAICAFRVRG